MLKFITRIKAKLPALDTVKARLYDILPHRPVDPANPVPFVAKAIKQIETASKRLDAEHRHAVRAVGISHKQREKDNAKALELHAQAVKMEIAARDRHAKRVDASVAQQKVNLATRTKLARAAANLKALSE